MYSAETICTQAFLPNWPPEGLGGSGWPQHRISPLVEMAHLRLIEAQRPPWRIEDLTPASPTLRVDGQTPTPSADTPQKVLLSQKIIKPLHSTSSLMCTMFLLSQHIATRSMVVPQIISFACRDSQRCLFIIDGIASAFPQHRALFLVVIPHTKSESEDRSLQFSSPGKSGIFSCPCELYPQQCAVPFTVMPHEWYNPTATATHAIPTSGTSHCW